MGMFAAFTKDIALSRRARAGLVVLAISLTALLIWGMSAPDPMPDELDTGEVMVKVHKPVPVPVNRKADVLDGFRGDVHPFLRGRKGLEVTARWTAPDRSLLKLAPAPDAVYSWYAGLQPIVPVRAYSERDFAAFLPETVSDVGQIWALDPDKMMLFLRQFHPNPSMHLVATGRRAGPDGAFAVLRGMSSTHLDIAFRMHTEFYITPTSLDEPQPVAAWYTPAYLAGEILVNKETGTVEHFHLALPTEKALNAFLTVNMSLLGIPKLGHDIVRVERMELAGGDEKLADKIIWSKSLSPTEAKRRLARTFYKFEEIDWVPYDQVLSQARDKDRPIFAIVSWGATDDQSC